MDNFNGTFLNHLQTFDLFNKCFLNFYLYSKIKKNNNKRNIWKRNMIS